MENQDTQEIEIKKTFLKRYKKNLACIERLEKRLALLTQRIESVKSPNFSGMPRGGVPVTFDELLSDKIELENRIKQLKAKKSDLKRDILQEIDSLEDPRYCEILESFFIDCLTLEDIADNEGYSVRHVYRLYDEAIRLLSVSCQ